MMVLGLERLTLLQLALALGSDGCLEDRDVSASRGELIGATFEELLLLLVVDIDIDVGK